MLHPKLSSMRQFFSTVEVPLRTRVKKDRRTTIAYWVVMMTILLYGGIYLFWRQRGYQASGQIAFSSEFRLRGSGAIITPDGLQVLDASELVQIYADGFFVATNYRETVQTRNSTCPGVGRPCSLAAPAGENGCPIGVYEEVGGQTTGRCISNAAAAPAPADTPPGGAGVCEVSGWCPHPGPGAAPTYQVLNWGNITWWWRVNVNMLGSIDRNKKLRTWSQELGPYSLAVTAAALDDDVLAAEVMSALEPGQPGADVALSVSFRCDLDNPTPKRCGLRKNGFVNETAPFSAFRLDPGGSRTGGALLVGTDLTNSTDRILRNMTGLRLRLAITGESMEADLYTTVFNVATLLWVTFISQWIAEIVLLRFTPNRKLYEEVVYRDIDERQFPAPPGAEAALPVVLAARLQRISSRLFDSMRAEVTSKSAAFSMSPGRKLASAFSSSHSLNMADGGEQTVPASLASADTRRSPWSSLHTDSDAGAGLGLGDREEAPDSPAVLGVGTTRAPSPTPLGAGPGARRQLLGLNTAADRGGGVAHLQSLPESPVVRSGGSSSPGAAGGWGADGQTSSPRSHPCWTVAPGSSAA